MKKIQDFVLEKFVAQTIGDLKTPEPQVLGVEEPIGCALEFFEENAIGSVIVSDENDMLAGIFTERDVMLKLALKDVDIQNTTFEQLMTPNPERVKQTASIARAVYTMSVGGFRHLPVVHAGSYPVGVLSIKDIVDYMYQLVTSRPVRSGLRQQQESLIEAFLDSYVHILRPQPARSVLFDDSLEKAVSMLVASNAGSVVVVDGNGVLRGIFTERDFIVKGVFFKPDLKDRSVLSIMTEEPYTVTAATSLAEAFRLMSEGGFRHIPVVDAAQQPVGLLSARDFLDYLAEGIVSDLEARIKS